MAEQQPHNAVPIEVENQFLVRLPQEPAEALREAIRSGASNLKDRLFIQLEPDKPTNPNLRRGQVKFDGWAMSAKLVDLPTIIESHKTIDKKTLYKTADVCQMLICKEGEPSDDEIPEEEEKKKDPNKVDKKYVCPHGLNAPLKNCRKRRFRKTLKKKHCLDEPEIEKEVKRLFRTDNEAVKVKFELLTEEELNASKGVFGSDGKTGDTSVGADDLFGNVSDLEEDGPDHDRSDGKIDPGYSEGESADFGDMAKQGPSGLSAGAAQLTNFPTQFSKDMFKSNPPGGGGVPVQLQPKPQTSSGNDAVANKMAEVNAAIADLRRRKQELERNIASCPNPMLQQKLREDLNYVKLELQKREMEADAFSMFS